MNTAIFGKVIIMYEFTQVIDTIICTVKHLMFVWIYFASFAIA